MSYVWQFQESSRTFSLPPRAFHSCVRINATTLLLFGGTTELNTFDPAKASDEIISVKCSSAAVEYLDVKDPPTAHYMAGAQITSVPPPRLMRHAAATIGNRMFVYGGVGTDAAVSDVLYVYNNATNSWSKARCGGDAPPARHGHTMVSVARTLFVFGGATNDAPASNKLHIYDSDKGLWAERTAGGTLPPPRRDHTCVLLGQYIYILGGVDASGKPLDDVFRLDLSAGEWAPLQTRGATPPARYGAASSVFNDGIFYVGGTCGDSPSQRFSDCWVLDTEKGRMAWAQIPPASLPSPCLGSTLELHGM